MPLKVFIVEDHKDIAEALSQLLAIDGLCEVVAHAGSQAEALAWSFQNEGGFDVAIVDLLLSEGSGFEVVSHLAKYQPGKVVVLSDFVNPAIAQRCMNLGAEGAFRKSQMELCVQYVRDLAQSTGEHA